MTVKNHGWTSMPELDKRAKIGAARAQKMLALLMPQTKADIAEIVFTHLHAAPRHTEVRFWSETEAGSYEECEQTVNKQGRNALAHEAGLDLTPLALDIYRRWPAVQPLEKIVMLSDGISLIFNAGRPENSPEEIISAHNNGQARAALLLPVQYPEQSYLHKKCGG